jgi:gliding motility-associated-like protein
MLAVGGEAKTAPAQSSVRFTENKGQWEKQVLFRADLDGGAMFLGANSFTYSFYDKDARRAMHAGNNQDKNSGPLKGHAFRMTFEGAGGRTVPAGGKPSRDYNNYYIGKDRSKWKSRVQNFAEVNYAELYQGIRLELLGLQNSLKYNFYVSPATDASVIRLRYEGLDGMKLEKGALILKTSINEIIEQKPYAYQWIGGNKVEVPCEFVLNGSTVAFNFPRSYDKRYELVIDPVLVFACSSGSTADNFGMTATYDAAGNLYSGGTVFGPGFPVTVGAYDMTYNGIVTYGRTDVVVTKYDGTGAFLHYSTYIGGALETEIVTSLVVDGQDQLLLYGATGSPDFPVTSNAYDTTFNGGINLQFVYNGSYFLGGTDIYVSKFNSTGTSLIASTFIGGSLNDGVNVNNDSTLFSSGPPPVYEFPADSLQYNYGDQFRGEINVDQSGNAYISSSTRSSNFPIVNGFDNTLGGEQDAVAFKLNQDFSVLVWSTYLGGSDNDAGYALALDDSTNVYITGGTRSINFPVTSGVLQPSYGGGKADGYITKINNLGNAIITSTYWGTAAYDQCYFVQLDKDNDVYVVGQTEGLMPVTSGVYSNANSGQFISKLNPTLNSLVFSTVFGNGILTPNISPSAFLVDYCENIYVSGWGGKIVPPVTTTTGMPVTGDAHQPGTDGHNFYLIVLATDAASLLYASYFGGPSSWEHVDGGTSRFDKKGIIYQSVCAGCGGNDDFPVTPGSWPNTGANVNHSSNCNNGTFKFDFQVAIADAEFTVDYLTGCAPLTVQFQNQSTTGGSYLWDFGGGDTTSTVVNPVRVYPNPGTYLVQLLVNNPASCNVWDTAYQYVTVYPGITSDFEYVTVPCSNEVQFTDSSAAAPVSWLWYFGDGDSSSVQNPDHVYDTTGTYDVQLIATNSSGCSDTTTYTVDFSSTNGNISANTSICLGGSATISASGGFAYSWAPAGSLGNPASASTTASPEVTTTYTVTISLLTPTGDTCTQQLTTTVNVFDPNTFPLTATADNDTISEGESTYIHAITDTTLTILWTPSQGLSDPNSFNPLATPASTTTYTVSIIDSSGCPRTASVTIYVLSSQCNTDLVYVPNTFTPNGDGNNDILRVQSNSVQELYFAVYNRWGQMVFETNDITKGWDGNYNGMKADPAVFAWYLRAKCYNGQELKKQGNTTLLR